MRTAMGANRTRSRTVSVEAKPEPIAIDLAMTAALVVDMQNDFAAKGGMFDRAGIDISITRAAIAPTARALAAIRQARCCMSGLTGAGSVSRDVRLSAQIGLITKLTSTALVYKCYRKQFRQEKEELRWT